MTPNHTKPNRRKRPLVTIDGTDETNGSSSNVADNDCNNNISCCSSSNDDSSNDHNWKDDNDSNNININSNNESCTKTTATTAAESSTPSESMSMSTLTSTTTDDGNGNLPIENIPQEIGKLTEEMGKLWWPTSNQELTKTHERDKYGRLVPAKKAANGNDVGGIGGEGSDQGGAGGGLFWNTASAPQDCGVGTSTPASSGAADAAATTAWTTFAAEWYDKWIASAQSATLNLVGHFRRRNDNDNGSRHPSDGALGDDKNTDMDVDEEIFEKMHPNLKKSIAVATNMDKFWAKELYEMNAREREDILNEIHGIPNRRKNKTLHETPERIEAAIRAFRKHLRDTLEDDLDNGDSSVPPVTKDAFRRAVFHLNSGYVLSNDFLIKFLRISNYETPKATLRYFRYLDLLKLLFGDAALTRPLALRDLTKREMRYLKKGQMQLLPSRDRAGRRIYAFSGCDQTGFNVREKYRTNIYLIDILSDDVPTQKLGAVSLNAPRVSSNDTKHPFGFEGMTLRMGKQELLGGQCTEAQFFRKINEAVPIRFSAIHYFAPQTIIYNIGKAIILSLLGKDHRKIVRFHAGSQLECEYSLRSFGIPHEDITITDGDNIKNKNVQKFINARKSIEAYREKQQRLALQQLQQRQPKAAKRPKADAPLPGQQQESAVLDETVDENNGPGIECPGVDCVVFGDKTMHGHPANVDFRELLRVMERRREEQLNNTVIAINGSGGGGGSSANGVEDTSNNGEAEIRSNANGVEDTSNNGQAGIINKKNNYGTGITCNILPIKEFVEKIIATARSSKHKLRFLCFDKSSHLFVDIRDHQELCKRVSQALRDQRKRARIEEQRLAAAAAAAAQTSNRISSSDHSHSRVLSTGEGYHSLKRSDKNYIGIRLNTTNTVAIGDDFGDSPPKRSPPPRNNIDDHDKQHETNVHAAELEVADDWSGCGSDRSGGGLCLVSSNNRGINSGFRSFPLPRSGTACSTGEQNLFDVSNNNTL